MSHYNPNIHHRRSIRLKGYDYSQEGLYFITLCCQNRAHLFGYIFNKEMILNDAGKMIVNQWLQLPDRFNNIVLHEFVVMPNHFHSIVQIVGATLVVAPKTDSDIIKGQPQGIAPTIAPTDNDINNEIENINKIEKTVGNIIGAFKSITTVEYINGVKNNNWKSFDRRIWERNYWEHIIRNEIAYQNISNYIINNPNKWSEDKFYNDNL